jgi:uncharacterized protein
LLETFVFLALRRTRSELSYYRTEKGREVDFLVADGLKAPALVQVCADMSDGNTKRREVVALEEAMTELELPHGTIVTLTEERSIQVDSGEIRVVPAWRWALES